MAGRRRTCLPLALRVTRNSDGYESAWRMTLITGDITKLELDAIVTAANEAYVGGHGVDGAVHRKYWAGVV